MVKPLLASVVRLFPQLKPLLDNAITNAHLWEGKARKSATDAPQQQQVMGPVVLVASPPASPKQSPPPHKKSPRRPTKNNSRERIHQ